MALSIRSRLFSKKLNQLLLNKRTINYSQNFKSYSKSITICGAITGGILSCYIAKQIYAYQNILGHVPLMNVQAREVHASEGGRVMQTSRELRFLSFASMEYEGNIYMTPQDFLESVMEEIPRARTGRTRLRSYEVDMFLRETPAKNDGSCEFFRNLHDRGLLSYTEYLFLLCVLTKPISGFRIAFNMFDTDGNNRVDKTEFLVLRQMLSGHSSGSFPGVKASLRELVSKHAMESKDRLPQNTTLMVHFFGDSGEEVLNYEDFYRFMENLQTEVLQLEFDDYARGMPTITEEEFARILLRYTILSKDDQDEYVDRLKKRIPHFKGISFENFKEFGQFLNNLDDFSIAMRMYTFANQPISEGEFKRAVFVCTGQRLDDSVVHTVFQLFDNDGDGQLSHKEFISVMQDRLHRGFKHNVPHTGTWPSIKSCIKNEMKTA